MYISGLCSVLCSFRTYTLKTFAGNIVSDMSQSVQIFRYTIVDQQPCLTDKFDLYSTALTVLPSVYRVIDGVVAK